MAERPKEIRKRIKSVSSTKKITKTMELVATSKMKRAQERVQAAGPYTAKLDEIISAIAGGGTSMNLPLLEKREKVSRVLVLLLTANRGLCGGFNANLIRLCKNTVAEQKAQGREVRLEVVGKKGNATLKFQGYQIARSISDVTDKPSFEDARRIVDPIVKLFVNREIDEVLVVYPHWKSMGSQPPTVKKLLPIDPPAGTAGKGGVVSDFIFSPSASDILEDLLPRYVMQTMYTMLAMSTAGEQVARRTAMKNATDNASEMITYLTRTLNRARQAMITQEIAEIVGGAAALQK
ncbi:MAG: ATP synthase F1 subunit gamma [Planctomycetes bacterium]|jgi:F-type H+-transporting ATPase subunit gamma|nr:ATP synthase F1 subunit gamma [Planctomycetota bacterium]MCL4730804.1 ATP synthase F1 subunit gamma [Planctomycetota bacterium]